MEQNHAIAALSQAFADYIVTCYEPKAIQDFIQGRYGYLLSQERQAVGDLLQIQLKDALLWGGLHRVPIHGP